ncbi:hypothetical protein F511_46147 [Dorcoceras hygrometricum]|uniref:Uncharacterized protein n=1 Tax=Dorcoceras hygrometricum TaxID=472368 RepID=A0A2Z7A1K9_9LAMI|nr:hypothetical protein F511_46147 [Dorcoceras hygrometricum]
MSALAASCLRDEAEGWRRVSRNGGWPMSAGRTLAARLPHEKRPKIADRPRKLLRTMGVEAAVPGAAGCATLQVAGRPIRDDERDRAPLLRRVKFFLAAAAGRPPLRRRSGDIVTAGLNSFRVWFGPVPGSP